eukprot:1712156-Amphidinium_carterae.1
MIVFSTGLSQSCAPVGDLAAFEKQVMGQIVGMVIVGMVKRSGDKLWQVHSTRNESEEIGLTRASKPKQTSDEYFCGPES